eukprot:TRINITY_DN24023_c0_g1_i2.p1 TRINITY_DN24023_c0_g1~~TRINITY_DN24023_c0_g1_i2.p1  ORF type:complete len:121 (+),score=40.39 TRINITY_DN24023_c0_g1_i2:66-428(+)
MVNKNKSNRPWKEQKKPISTLNATKESKTSFAKRRERQKQMDVVKKLGNEMKEEANRKKEQERKRLEALKKQKEENLMKSVKVQVIKDAKKIKRMSKKQLLKSRIYLKNHMNSTSGTMDR